MPHPIENIMETSVEKLKEIADVNTVVGKPVLSGEEGIILPISKVSLGFMSGGGEYAPKPGAVKKSGEAFENAASSYPFAGAAVAGVSLTPMGFLYVNGQTVRLLSTSYASPIERVIDMVPQLLEKVEGMLTENGGEADAGCI